MTALVGSVFLASLLGSVHCAGMCGAFVIAGGNQTAYHGGRLVTYGLLGALAGTLGATIDLGGALLGVQRLGLLLAAAAMFLFGIAMLVQLFGFASWSPRPPAALRRIYLAAVGRLTSLDPTRRSLGLGLLSTLLPCGWLYAFVAVAAGSGTPWHGALVMAVFWIGTVPILAAIGWTRGRLGRAHRGLSAVAAILLVVVGLMGLTQRWNVSLVPTPATSVEEVAGCHDVAD